MVSATSLSITYSGPQTLTQTILGNIVGLSTPANLTALTFGTTSGNDLTIDSGGADFSAFTNASVSLTSAAALSGGVITTAGTLTIENGASSSITTSGVTNFAGVLGADLNLAQNAPMTIAAGGTSLSLGATLTIATTVPAQGFVFFPDPSKITKNGAGNRAIVFAPSLNNPLTTDQTAIATLLAAGITVTGEFPAPAPAPRYFVRKPKPAPIPVPPTPQPEVPPQNTQTPPAQTREIERILSASAGAGSVVTKIFESPKTSVLSGSMAVPTPNYTTVIAQRLEVLPSNMSDIPNTGSSMFSMAGGMIKIDLSAENRPWFVKLSKKLTGNPAE